MDSTKTSLILGPPGTGKTTECLRIVEALLEDGYAPGEIGFVTFTRKGAAEARTRACAKFKFSESQLPWFKTLHALAFMQLGLSKNQVMGFGDYCALCAQLGLSITSKGIAEDGTVSGLSHGDRLFFMENMARAQLMTLRAYWEAHPEEGDIHWYELELVANTVAAYKKANGKRDFTDVITDFCASPVCPPIRALIVDEAQDLTPLQWKMASALCDVAEECHVAGDDDQAIFKWAGADVEYFIGLANAGNCRAVTQLPQSFRVPISIQKVAEEIASRMENRVNKHWAPRPVEGTVDRATAVDQIDMGKGTWLLLARNVFLLQAYNDYCIQMGYVFDSSLGSPIRGDSLQAIRAWEELRKGQAVSALYVKMIYDLMTVKEQVKYGMKGSVAKLPDDAMLTLVILRHEHGLLTEAIWHESLSKLDSSEVAYFVSALKRGEKLLREPRIRIATIHAVKGGEADHVAVMTDMAPRTWQEFQENPDDEHRVWYVAVTRAKESLHIISPTTDRSYDI